MILFNFFFMKYCVLPGFNTTIDSELHTDYFILLTFFKLH